MKPLTTKLTTLTDDFLQLIKQWNENPHKTAGQQKLWPGDKIFEYAGADYPNSLRLLAEDGFDNKPVFGTFTSEQLINAITNRETLPFSATMVTRMGKFFHLNAFQTIVLLTKCYWETFLIQQTHRNDLEWLSQTSRAEEFLPAFLEDESLLFELKSTWLLMNTRFGIEKELGINDELYGQLIHYILISRVYYFAITSSETASFIGNQLQLTEMLKAENSEYNDIYHARNKQWLFLVQTAENSHLRIEDQRLLNAEIERKWLTLFGNEWYELMRTDFALQSMKRQLEMKQQNPSMSIEELAEADRLAVETEMAQLQSLEIDINVNQIYSENTRETNDGQAIDPSIFERYKKVLRLIWIKTHPDKVTDKGFTPEQLELLAKYYQQATELGTAERIINPRTLQRLEEILVEVDELYQNIGLNLTLNTAVKGNSLKEKVQWLESQIKLIGQELTQLNNEHFSLANDTNIKQKESSIQSEQVISDMKQQLAERKKTLERELSELKLKFGKLFK